MDDGTLTIYSASAGSGKTFNLAGVYLARLFRSKFSYRKILAVTFTNKATAEMKDRILEQLHRLATGAHSEYLEALIRETGKPEEMLRQEAGEILFSILHDYSRFSVCTIDAFFQKVIRAFAREHGLHSGFSIELENSNLLLEAVGEMIAASPGNEQLGSWLNSYVMANLDDEKTWNLKGEIMKLAEELFREKFKILASDERSKLEDKEFLNQYITSIKSLSSSFRIRLADYGKKILKIFSDHELDDDMFYYRSSGIPAFVRGLSGGKTDGPNAHARKIEADQPKWSTGNPSPQLQAAIAGGLDDILKEAIRYYDENIIVYNSAKVILENIFALGILADVLLKVREISSSGNIFLIADAGELLSLITKESQTPFIYEKIGNRYENYMIDEFQDTSHLQWDNFRVLIDESMAGGHDNLVVGDVKQSIYRFRNSDWQILGKMKDEMIDNKRIISKPLKTNWRSCSNIIRFNNSLFSIIPGQLDRSALNDEFSLNFTRLYSETVQEDPGIRKGGYVRIEFIDDETEDEKPGTGGKGRNNNRKWRDKVLEKLPRLIETCLDSGYNSSDIGILVRDSRDGADVLNTIIEYNNSFKPERRKLNIVSNDSLLLTNSHAITFIISVLRVLDDPDDLISRAQMVRFYLLARGEVNSDAVPLYVTSLDDGKNSYLPDGYELFLERARQMTLFEATENIISFFNLGHYPWNVSYLNTFQDWILTFSKTKNIDFQSFLEWWDATGNSKSVILPAADNAARIFTIHKSKGLEFKVVIIPFISWNLDHKNNHHPILWIKPGFPPFDSLGIVPVRYQKSLQETIFSDDYLQEKYAAFIDNINLLYVALTRAVDSIYGFAPESPGPNNGISKILKEAIISDENPAGDSGIVPGRFYNRETRVFEFGEMPVVSARSSEAEAFLTGTYTVSPRPDSLRLKLHGQNYFPKQGEIMNQKISYGNIMHEVFEGISTIDDIPAAVKKLVLEGKIMESESASLITKLNTLISDPAVSEWFQPGIMVLKEKGILLPSGFTLRPDRVILKDDSAVIVDFKFGEENRHHADQIRHYRKLLTEMGFRKIDAFLWYVDMNKIVRA